MHNFYAGPSILSEYTIKNTAAAVENFAGMGLSLLEISHRSKEFIAVNDEARALDPKNCWMFLPVMRLFSWVEVQACSSVWCLTIS